MDGIDMTQMLMAFPGDRSVMLLVRESCELENLRLHKSRLTVHLRSLDFIFKFGGARKPYVGFDVKKGSTGNR